MFNNLLQQIVNLGLPREIIVVIVGAFPIFELRGAIPLAMFSFAMPWYEAFFLSVIGNMLPVPFLLLFLGKMHAIARRTKQGEKLFNWVFRHTKNKGSSLNRYEWMGLMIFVAVPLPLTGAWTASIIAFLLEMRFWYAFSSIFVGVLIAGVIVVSLSLLGWIGAVIAGIGLAVIAILGLRKKAKRSNRNGTAK